LTSQRLKGNVVYADDATFDLSYQVSDHRILGSF